MKLQLNNFAQINSQIDEIKLFKELQRHLSNYYKCVFIDRTHQQYVKFVSSLNNCPKTRELSDLWIIAYSHLRKEARMTFLQAKFERKNLKGQFKFNGDYYQYDLLSKRPSITDNGKFKFPSNILSSAILDSVGSFGVFYYDNNSHIDFAYSTASDISYQNSVTCNTKNKTLYFKSPAHGSCIINVISPHTIELRQSLFADIFELALINLFIGTIVNKDKKLMVFLKSFFKGLQNANDVVNDFIEFINLFQIDLLEDQTKHYENPNILLINVDPKG